MSIYGVRACRAQPGKGDEVKALLKKGEAAYSQIIVYQSMGDVNDFGVFGEFANEADARAFASSAQQLELTQKLASLVDMATGVSVWKRV